MYDFLNDALFPKFRKFIPEDYSPYRTVYEMYYAPHADISVANLVAWLDIDHTLEISRLDDAIVLRYRNPFEYDSENYLLLEPNLSKEHVRQIYDLALPADNVMREHPKALLSKLENDPDILLVPNRASCEYILDVEQHASVLGGSFYRQRYEVTAFERIHSGRSLMMQIKEFASDDDKQLLFDLLSRWQLTANVSNSSKVNHERRAISRAIESLDVLQRPFAILLLDDKPIAFSLFAIYGDTAIVGHVKVDYEYRFIFDYMVHRLAKAFKDRSVKYINFEQDLGIEGLRLHKSRLRPIRMLEKVDIKLLR